MTKREALITGLVTVAGAFGALAAGAAVLGTAFEQLANAFSDNETQQIAAVLSEATEDEEEERKPMGFTA